jgi:flagellar basal-body rod modification protein FlgD
MPGMVRSITEQLFDELAPQQQTKTPTKQLGKEDFLKLLTLQLRSQNPLNPASNQEMAAQLAQFSALEQMQNINTTLEQLLQSNASLALQIAQYSAPALIGKTARVSSSQVSYDGTKAVSLGYHLTDTSAVEGTIEIRSASGVLVRRIQLASSEVAAGTHTIEWDGRDDRGQLVPPGTYSVSIRARTNNGADVAVTSFVRGTITGVRYSSNGLMVLLGALEVPISNIIEIS